MRSNSQHMARKRPLGKRPLKKRHLGRGHLVKRPLGKTHLSLWQSGEESASPSHCPGRSPPKTGAETEEMRALCP
ncbi:unnamed protein product [Gadus morhua 'NCC']